MFEFFAGLAIGSTIGAFVTANLVRKIIRKITPALLKMSRDQGIEEGIKSVKKPNDSSGGQPNNSPTGKEMELTYRNGLIMLVRNDLGCTRN